MQMCEMLLNQVNSLHISEMCYRPMKGKVFVRNPSNVLGLLFKTKICEKSCEKTLLGLILIGQQLIHKMSNTSFGYHKHVMQKAFYNICLQPIQSEASQAELDGGYSSSA
ncbi:MAG: hypothetical protein ACKPKO_48560 [Candidatus Fonsibacter sp.]